VRGLVRRDDTHVRRALEVVLRKDLRVLNAQAARAPRVLVVPDRGSEAVQDDVVRAVADTVHVLESV